MTDWAGSEPAAGADQLAALTFDRWEHRQGEWTPPSNEDWARLANSHLISIRLAWLTLHKTKEELIGMSDQLGNEGLMELVGQIGQSADWFKSLHDILSAAERRLMSAFAAGLSG